MPQPEPTDGTSPSTGNSLAAQARRWRRRTTDLLAIGLLLVAGLAVGRQLTAWWNEPTLSEVDAEAIVATTGPGDAWDKPDELQLGDLPLAVRRRQVHGDRDAAWVEIEAAVGEIASSTPWPSGEADQEEQDLLQQLQNREPRAQPADGIAMFRIEGPLPMIVARKQRRQSYRVIAWGLALPVAGDTWIGWTFSGAVGEQSDVAISLPAQSQRLLSLRGSGSQQLVVFTGQPSSDAWLKHFQSELDRRGWQMTGLPVQRENGWTARFRMAPDRNAVISTRCDNSGTWHGMLNLFTTPAVGSTLEPTRAGTGREAR